MPVALSCLSVFSLHLLSFSYSTSDSSLLYNSPPPHLFLSLALNPKYRTFSLSITSNLKHTHSSRGTRTAKNSHPTRQDKTKMMGMGTKAKM